MFDDAEIADRQHVGPLEAEDQEHLRRPSADPFYLGQRLDDRFVVHSIEDVERQLSFFNPSAQIAQVAELLRAQTDPAQPLVRHGKHL